MDFARGLRWICEELNPFLFEREREGYKGFAACTVGLYGEILVNTLAPGNR